MIKQETVTYVFIYSLQQFLRAYYCLFLHFCFSAYFRDGRLFHMEMGFKLLACKMCNLQIKIICF